MRFPPSSKLLNVAANPLRLAICDILFWMKKIVFKELRCFSSSSGTCLMLLNERSNDLDVPVDISGRPAEDKHIKIDSREVLQVVESGPNMLDLVVVEI